MRFVLAVVVETAAFAAAARVAMGGCLVGFSAGYIRTVNPV